MSMGMIGTRGYVSDDGTSVTQQRSIKNIQESLTGIDAQSDAWGKTIPLSFGRARVAGVLVWASQFYKTTTDYDDTVTTKNIYTSHTFSYAEDSVARGGSYQGVVVNEPQDVSRSTSQVTHGENIAYGIDLCYSFGLEGDKRKKRFVDRIRINEVLVYDRSTAFTAAGLGFSVRYGYDNAPPAALASYPNGIFTYPGQTLVIFEKFPTADFGDRIPESIDVEFGCCDDSPAQCVFLVGGVRQYQSGAPFVPPQDFRFQEGFLVVMVCAEKPDSNSIIKDGWTQTISPYVVGGKGYFYVYAKILDAATTVDWNNNGVPLGHDDKSKVLLYAFTYAGLSLSSGFNLSHLWHACTLQYFDAGVTYDPIPPLADQYCLYVKFDPETLAFEYDGAFYEAGGRVPGSSISFPSNAAFVVARLVPRSPCEFGDF